MAQAGYQSNRLPMAMKNRAEQPFTGDHGPRSLTKLVLEAVLSIKRAGSGGT
jgi:hypothetical protein